MINTYLKMTFNSSGFQRFLEQGDPHKNNAGKRKDKKKNDKYVPTDDFQFLGILEIARTG